MRRPGAAFLALALAACSPPAERDREWPEAALDGPRVTVMTFNVENLFDAKHDPGKDDRAFLPLSEKKSLAHAAACAKLRREHWREQCLHWDWNEKALRIKLARLAGAILSAGEGRGPDILILEEVENAAVLERLRENLAPAGYRPGMLIEGGDPRGIDAAVLTRLASSRPPRLHPMPGAPPAARGILEVPLVLPDGTPLTVFAVHLPSPGSPRAYRERGLRFLNTLAAALPRGALAVAGGDFNITADEDAAYSLVDGILGATWLVSHRIGCAGCRGTNYYAAGDSWSFLDMILLSRSFHPAEDSRWTVLRDSVRVVSDGPLQKGRGGAPSRYDPLFGTGVSDHFPLMLTLARRRGID